MASNKTQDHHRRSVKRIPGGTQLLSKRPESFLPGQWPGYYSRAKGIEVWDLDDRCYMDMTHTAIGACPLGFADDDVDSAVKGAVDAGTMTTLNCPEELHLAEVLCELHPSAEMVRYGRTGGEMMAVAVRIARVATGREKVAFCGYHGWHDWYLASNLSDRSSLDGHLLPGLDPAGVPRRLAGTAFPFEYNRLDQFQAILDKHGAELAAIVLEPVRYVEPEKGFLENLRAAADKIGAVLIFDEISAGWRMALGGSHLLHGVAPDIAVFAKGMSNGYPMAAAIGTSDVMACAQDSFISSTYWTERIGPTAALATIDKLQKYDVPAHLARIGARVQQTWVELGEAHGLSIEVFGRPQITGFRFVGSQEPKAVSSLFTQEMLARGFLATPSFYPTFAHRADHLDKYAFAVDEVFAFLSKAIETGTVSRELKGPVSYGAFRRLT